MNPIEMLASCLVWFFTEFIPSVFIGAIWNYLFFWIPLALLFFIFKWLLPGKVKKRISAWFDKPVPGNRY